jgi:two-component system OmpR family response regulator
MHSFRILHVDDEPDIREVVEISLGLDPCFEVRSCASGGEALTVAAGWMPDVILCDVTMPIMDGPATLARLRERPQTAKIPVIFMTARVQRRELEHFKTLSVAGVIYKPFDPMTLATEIRNQIRETSLAALSLVFAIRVRSDAEALARFRSLLIDRAQAPAAIEEIKAIAHALAGSAGLYGRDQIGDGAARLHNAIVNRTRGTSEPGEVERELDTLLTCIAA